MTTGNPHPEDVPLADHGRGQYVDSPSDAPSAGGLRAVFAKAVARVLPIIPRTVVDAIRAGRAEIPRRTQSWRGLCLMFVRTRYGWTAGIHDARTYASKVPRKYRHYGRVEDAPRGALLLYDIGEHGHIAIATGIKTNDKCLSNDYMRQGEIDYAPRRLPRWGARYMFWTEWTPAGLIKVGTPVRR